MPTNPDFRDLFAVFNGGEVRYVVVGAYAVIHYTEPRYTKDLDVWVKAAPDNARAVFQALVNFGAPLEGLQMADLANPDMVYQIGIEPNRIDIIMGMERLDFDTSWSTAESTSYGDVPIKVLGLDDLIVAKRTAARPQDLLDLKKLEQARIRRGLK